MSLNQKKVAWLNSNTSGLPSVAEAGAIVTVAASLSLIVPVAEAVPVLNAKVRHFYQSNSGSYRLHPFPAVAPAGRYGHVTL
jgi:hypothetical protein